MALHKCLLCPLVVCGPIWSAYTLAPYGILWLFKGTLSPALWPFWPYFGHLMHFQNLYKLRLKSSRSAWSKFGEHIKSFIFHTIITTLLQRLFILYSPSNPRSSHPSSYSCSRKLAWCSWLFIAGRGAAKPGVCGFLSAFPCLLLV